MRLSTFPSSTYWRDYLFSMVYSYLLCYRLIDCTCVGLFLDSLFCSTDLHIWFCLHMSNMYHLMNLGICIHTWWGPGGLVMNLPANAGDAEDIGSILRSGRSLGGGHGNSFQYSCLENLMDRGAWWAMVIGVAKSWTRLSTSMSLIFSWGERF